MEILEWSTLRKSVEIMVRCNGFLSLKMNMLIIQSVLFPWYALVLEHR